MHSVCLEINDRFDKDGKVGCRVVMLPVKKEHND